MPLSSSLEVISIYHIAIFWGDMGMNNILFLEISLVEKDHSLDFLVVYDFAQGMLSV